MIVRIYYDNRLNMSKTKIAHQVAEASFGLRFKGRPSRVIVEQSSTAKIQNKITVLLQSGYKHYVHVDTTGGKLTTTALAFVDESK